MKMKMAVFICVFALALVSTQTRAQNKDAPQPKRGPSVCVQINPDELPPDSPYKMLADIAKALKRPMTCQKCTSDGQVSIVCAMSCPADRAC